MNSRDHIEASIAEVQSLLESLPENAIITRMSMAAHLADLLGQLNDLPHVGLARIGVSFTGGPVYGSLGIEARYAGKVIDCFSSAVKWQANRRGARSSNLYIVAPLHGSFGFLFEEIGQMELGFDVSKTAEAIADVVELIETSSQQSREPFIEKLKESAPYSISSIREMMKVIHGSGAQMSIVVDNRSSWFDHEKVENSHKTLNSVIVDNSDRRIPGYFAGVLPNSRTFEHASEGPRGKVYKGDLNLGIDADDLKQWIDRYCIANIRITKTIYPGRKPRYSYTLLSISDPGKPEAETESVPANMKRKSSR